MGSVRLVSRAKPEPELVRMEHDVLAKNDELAALNRKMLERSGILALNLVSSPGAGKTTLLEKTIHELAGRIPVSVIEGDQETENDAERIRRAGAPAVQVNTGTGCHLDSEMVKRGLERLGPRPGSIVMIENVGNLVCPALFDLGEAVRVAILSVTEGEDKPLKYPHLFRSSQLLVLNKIDLLPYVDFSRERCFSYARRINPAIGILEVAATRGDGMAAWIAWIGSELERRIGHGFADPMQCRP